MQQAFPEKGGCRNLYAMNVIFRSNTHFRLVLTLIFVISTIAANAQMEVESLDGAVTRNEFNSFKSYIRLVAPGTGGNLNPKNDWVMHDSGQQTRAMGLLYEMTGDQDILDRMIQFCDEVLSQRNDLAESPLGGYTIWTGRIDPVWPNVDTIPIGTGGEQGDPPGHLAYCAKLILETPSIWGTTVRVGDPKDYGATYLDRAKRFVQEADYTMDHHVLSDLLDLSDRNRMYWSAGNPYMSGAVPWNQQVMFNYPLQYLADAHKILGDDPTRLSKYESIVQASVDWFFSGEAGAAKSYTDSKGNTAYLWAYRPPSGTEDFGHANYDIQGIYRAYESGKYGITNGQMLPLANTLMDVIRRGENDYAGKVNGTDGTGNASGRTSIYPGWYVMSLFRPDDYLTIVSEDLSEGGTTTDFTRFSYFLWIKQIRHPANGLPTAPSGLIATLTSGNEINLNWNDNTAGGANFVVQRSNDGGASWYNYTTVEAGKTNFTDEWANPARTYIYRILATNFYGISDVSNTVEMTTDDQTGSLPRPWLYQDIGSAELHGTSSFSNNTFTLAGSGTDIWGTADQFQYVSQLVSGDGEIMARVNRVDNTNKWAKAGVMIRETLNNNSAHALMAVSSASGTAFQRRKSTDGSSTNTSGGSYATPYWVKLVRKGDLITGYQSPDGINWSEVGSETIAMSADVTVGLVVCSHEVSALCSAQISNVSVTFPDVVTDAESLALRPVHSGTTFSFKTGVTESGRIVFPQELSGVKKQVSVYDLMGRLIQTSTTSGNDLILKSGATQLYGIFLLKGFVVNETE